MAYLANDLLLEEALKAEDYLHESRTRLDTKAASVYAAAAVLAIQPSILLMSDTVTILVMAIQGLGYIFLGCSVYWAYEAQDLTHFPIPDVASTEGFRNTTFAKAPANASESELKELMLTGLLKGTHYRIKLCETSNAAKASQVARSFQWLFLALLTNVAAFVLHVLCRYLTFRYPLHPC